MLKATIHVVPERIQAGPKVCAITLIKYDFLILAVPQMIVWSGNCLAVVYSARKRCNKQVAALGLESESQQEKLDMLAVMLGCC